MDGAASPAPVCTQQAFVRTSIFLLLFGLLRASLQYNRNNYIKRALVVSAQVKTTSYMEPHYTPWWVGDCKV